MRKFTHPQRLSAVPVSVPATADNGHLRHAEKCGIMVKTNAKAEMPRRLLHFMDF